MADFNSGVIQRCLKWRYRLGLSVGDLVALVRGVARLGQEEYNQLQQEIRASPVVYGDEMGWREDGRHGYLWSFSNPEVRCFLRRASRGRQVVAEVFWGDEFDGVLISDFYGAYNVHQEWCSRAAYYGCPERVMLLKVRRSAAVMACRAFRAALACPVQ